jgi:hypothetical protein
MSTYLPKEVREGLDAARRMALKKSSRLRVESGEQSYRVLRLWENGFAMEATGAPHLRGIVDLFDGARYLSQCLIVASAEDDGEMQYEFKWSTAALDHAPLDFAKDKDAPIALLAY